MDGIITITGAGTTNFGMLKRTLTALQEHNGNVLGVVVNAIKQSPGGYLRKNIAQFYASDRSLHGNNEPSIMIVKD